VDYDLDYDDYDDSENEGDEVNSFVNIFEEFTNKDMPETRYVYILDDDEFNRSGVVIKSIGIDGQFVESCYDVESIELLINTLEECKETLINMDMEADDA